MTILNYPLVTGRRNKKQQNNNLIVEIKNIKKTSPFFVENTLKCYIKSGMKCQE